MGEKKWFGHRFKSEGFVRKVYVRKSVDQNSRGKSLGRWRDRVKEYMCERYDYRGRSRSSMEAVFG